MSLLIDIKTMLRAFAEGKAIFKEGLRVKLTPHANPFEIWGAWQGPEGVYLMDGAGEWHGPLLENQMNATQIIRSLYQRLKILSHAS